MINIRNIVILCLSMVVMSCGEEFLDINQDPNRSVEADPALLFTRATNQFHITRAIEAGTGENIFAQSWSSGQSAGVFSNPEKYVISPYTTGNTWSTYYVTAQKNLALAIDIAESSDPVNNNAAAQSKLVRALIYFETSLTWEDVPFKQANNPEFDQPEFDDQQTVFNGVLSLIDSAKAQIDLGSPLKIEAADLYYNGDMTKWIKFANSLKLKVLMTMVETDPSKETEIAALLAEGNMISSQEDSFIYPFFDVAGNKNPYWRLLESYGNSEEAFLYGGYVTVNIMNKLEDPRREPFLTEGDDAEEGEFNGVRPGEAATSVSSYVDKEFIAADAGDAVLTYAEQLLFEAEAIAKGYAPGGLSDANEKYKAGIRASMAMYEVPESEANTYVNSLEDLSASANPVYDIHIQQYINYFGRGIDVWTQWRRTGVPELLKPVGATLSNVIRRLPYPPDEVSANPKTPTQPSLDTPMWFSK